jgi:hypothetical protein
MQFVGIVPPNVEYTPELLRASADRIIEYLNKMDWTYPQSFKFVNDETIMKDGKVNGKLDDYLLNQDIGGVVGKYLYTNLYQVVSHTETINEIFGDDDNRKNCKQILEINWSNWN